MTSFEAARPRYKLPLAGEEFDLVGTMELVEAVEYALGRGVGYVAIEVIDVMPGWELAKLLSAVVTASGGKLSVPQAKNLLWDTVGLSGDANKLLRVHLYQFLAICLAPPEQREERANKAGELLGRLSEASRGGSTSSSASAS